MVEARNNLIDVIKSSKNMLSIYETMFAKIFINEKDEEEIKSNIIRFLYGPEAVDIRLRELLAWAKVTPIPGENKKKGFSAQVATFFPFSV